MEFKFEDTNDHSVEEQEELFEALTKKAASGEYTEFEYIKNTSEWWVMKKAKTGLYKVIELYDNLIQQLYDIYCRQIKGGDLSSDVLFAMRQFKECKAFYEVELATTNDMLSEYWAYIGSGHFINQWFLLGERETEQLWDHRGNDNGK